MLAQKKKRKKKKEEEEAAKGYRPPETAQNFFGKNATTNRAAIEAKKNPKPWTLKVALRLSGVLLVFLLIQKNLKK